VKQRRYVDCYDGDIRQSAKKAGISYQYAKELHTKTYYAHVFEKIGDINDQQSKKNIWNRQQRQEFWTNMAQTAEKDSDRLKASELLGRSFADFIERKEITGNITLEERLSEIRR
jgi:molybdenum-dependent DNA-binding transcriptional regulator ModE